MRFSYRGKGEIFFQIFPEDGEEERKREDAEGVYRSTIFFCLAEEIWKI